MKFLQTMACMIEWPLLAAVPAGALLVLYLLSKRRLVLVVALVWLCYLPYEFAMKLRILCSGECNIRVDLLLIYPLLAVLSVAALLVGIVAGRRK